jgi:hypothetical protein
MYMESTVIIVMYMSIVLIAIMDQQIIVVTHHQAGTSRAVARITTHTHTNMGHTAITDVNRSDWHSYSDYVVFVVVVAVFAAVCNLIHCYITLASS